jgi:hypothetical protein
VAIALAGVVLALATTMKTRPSPATSQVVVTPSPVSPRPAQAITPAGLANLAAADRRYSTWQATRSADVPLGDAHPLGGPWRVPPPDSSPAAVK